MQFAWKCTITVFIFWAFLLKTVLLTHQLIKNGGSSLSQEESVTFNLLRAQVWKYLEKIKEIFAQRAFQSHCVGRDMENCLLTQRTKTFCSWYYWRLGPLKWKLVAVTSLAWTVEICIIGKTPKQQGAHASNQNMKIKYKTVGGERDLPPSKQIFKSKGDIVIRLRPQNDNKLAFLLNSERLPGWSGVQRQFFCMNNMGEGLITTSSSHSSSSLTRKLRFQ